MSEQLKRIGDTTCAFRMLAAFTERNAVNHEQAQNDDPSCAHYINNFWHLTTKEYVKNYTDLFPLDFPPAAEGGDHRAPGKLSQVLVALSKRLTPAQRETLAVALSAGRLARLSPAERNAHTSGVCLACQAHDRSAAVLHGLHSAAALKRLQSAHDAAGRGAARAVLLLRVRS